MCVGTGGWVGVKVDKDLLYLIRPCQLNIHLTMFLFD